jgi:hypothetical protein
MADPERSRTVFSKESTTADYVVTGQLAAAALATPIADLDRAAWVPLANISPSGFPGIAASRRLWNRGQYPSSRG